MLSEPFQYDPILHRDTHPLIVKVVIDVVFGRIVNVIELGGVREEHLDLVAPATDYHQDWLASIISKSGVDIGPIAGIDLPGELGIFRISGDVLADCPSERSHESKLVLKGTPQHFGMQQVHLVYPPTIKILFTLGCIFSNFQL